MMIATSTRIARLEVLTGPTRGQKLTLERPSILIGRHASCDVVLDDAAVSRRHVRLERRGEDYYLIDLQSLNGTTVNGRRVREPRLLQNGDLIHVHCFVLAFLEGAAAAPAEPSSAALHESDEDSEAELVDRMVASICAQGGSHGDFPSAVRIARHLVRYLGVAYSVDEVLHRGLEALFSLLPQSDRGLVLLSGPAGQLDMRAVKMKSEEAFNSLTSGPIPRRLAAQVMREERAVLLCDRWSHAHATDNDHVIDACPRWTMYAPLLGPGANVAGIVQLDTQDDDRPFAPQDLEMFLLAVLIIGLAYENALAVSAPRGDHAASGTG